jgi:tRNA nucleotidyltransferase/poly(A) polymerase
LGFTFERKTLAAMKRRHACILTASVPRVCEEVFRLFTYGQSETAFRLAWEVGLLGDLLPELAAYVERSGGRRSPLWRHLASLDAYERMMSEKGFDVPNGLRAAVMMTGLFREAGREGAGRKVMQPFLTVLKLPKAAYFEAVLLLESAKRLSVPPSKGKSRFVHNRDFLDALDYNRIVLRAEKKDESVLNEWADLYEEKGNS